MTITDVLPRIAVTKTADPSQLDAPGGDVTYTVTIANLVEEPLTVVAIEDDKLGDLADPGNRQVSDNTCAKAGGFAIPVGATASCTFTARLEGEPGDEHVNTVTVTAADDDPVQPAAADVQPAAVNTVTATASATVTFVKAEAAGAGGGEQPPTDMLAPTDSLSAASGAGILGGSLGWALWVLVAATVIVSGAWVIRRQRLGQI